MGYRSNLKLEIKLEDLTPKEILKQVEEIFKEETTNVFNKIYINRYNNSLILVADYIKWDKSYKDVRAFDNWLTDVINQIDDKEKNGFVYGVRFGEEYNDVEIIETEEGYWQSTIQFKRKIEINQTDGMTQIFEED